MNSRVSEFGRRWLARSALVAGLIMLISQLTFPDPDMFHAMALIRESLRLGHVPQVDVFAYTPTVAPATHHEWGSGAVIYFVAVVCGLGAGGLLCLKYLLTGTVVSGCYLGARREGGPEFLCVLLAPIAILLGWIGFTTIRAQLFTLVFLTVQMLFFTLDRRGQRWWVWLWLPLFVVWLNIHGGVLAGVGLYGLHAGEQFLRTYSPRQNLREALSATRHLTIGGMLMLPLFLLNPYGVDFGPCLLDAVRLERPLIAEWGPLWSSPDAGPLLTAYALSVLVVVYALRERGWTQLPGLPLVLISGWMALMHIRHGSIYAVIWMCLAPGYLAGTPFAAWVQRVWEQRQDWVTTAAAVGVIFCGSIAAANRPWELQLPTTQAIGPLLYPSGAVDYLERAGFQGNLMTPFRAGAYVSWRLYPQVKISFDGRYEAAYPPEALAENFDFYDAKSGWRETLTRYATDAVLVPTATELCRRLSEDAGWRRIYEDDGYSILAAPAIAANYRLECRRGEPVTMTFP